VQEAVEAVGALDRATAVPRGTKTQVCAGAGCGRCRKDSTRCLRLRRWGRATARPRDVDTTIHRDVFFSPALPPPPTPRVPPRRFHLFSADSSSSFRRFFLMINSPGRRLCGCVSIPRRRYEFPRACACVSLRPCRRRPGRRPPRRWIPWRLSSKPGWWSCTRGCRPPSPPNRGAFARYAYSI
jgi:hypothetical protein